MAGIGHYNYAGIPLEEKHGWFQTGPGATAAAQTSDSLKRIAARLDVSDATIGAGFIERQLGTSWEGNAAQAASGAFNRAAAVLASLSTSSLSGGGTAQQFGDSFNATKNAIPTPPPPVGVNSTVGAGVDSFADWARSDNGPDLSSLGIQSDYRARLVANQNAEHAANDALQRHENTSRDVLAGYQSAAAPPTAPAAQPSASMSGAVPATTGGTGAGTGGSAAGTHGAGGAGGGAAAGKTSAGGTAAGGAGSAAGHAGAASTGHPGGAPGGTAASGTGSHGGTATASAGATPPGGSGSMPGSGGGFGANGGAGGYGANGYGNNGGYGAGGGTAGGYLPAGGGYVPSGGAYQPGSSSWTPGRYSGGGTSGGGTSSGYRNIAGEEPLAPRTGGEPNPAVRGGTGAAGSAGMSSAAVPGRGAGPGGMAPMGMGGAGAGGSDREHRNQFYIPEDEPFRIDYDFYVAPPVLGAGAPSDDWDDRDGWGDR